MDNVLQEPVRTYFDLIEVCLMTFLTRHMASMTSFVVKALASSQNKAGQSMEEDGSRRNMMSIDMVAYFGHVFHSNQDFIDDHEFMENALSTIGGKCAQQIDHYCCYINLQIPAIFSNIAVTSPSAATKMPPVPVALAPVTEDGTETSSTNPPTAVTTPMHISNDMACRIKVRVLLVEDSIMLQKMISRYLTRLDCEVDSASIGQQGLLMLMKHQYDIVFTDFLMPVMNGIAMMREYMKWWQVKQDPSYKHPVIIGMSATAQEVEQHEAFSSRHEFLLLETSQHQDFEGDHCIGALEPELRYGGGGCDGHEHGREHGCWRERLHASSRSATVYTDGEEEIFYHDR
jgi:CheY-like chemotaxis protein